MIWLCAMAVELERLSYTPVLVADAVVDQVRSTTAELAVAGWSATTPSADVGEVRVVALDGPADGHCPDEI